MSGIDSARRGVAPGSVADAQLLVERALANLRRNDFEAGLADFRLALDARVLPPGPTAAVTTMAARCTVSLEQTDRYDEVERELAGLEPFFVGNALEMWTDLRVALVRRLGSPPARVAELLATAPRFTRQDPPPAVADRLTRASLRYEAGDLVAALAEIDQLITEALDAEDRRRALQLGALCIAVLDDRTRLPDAKRWAAELRSAAGPDGPGRAARFSCAAVAAVDGDGAEAVADLEAALAVVLAARPERAPIRAHALIALAHLNAGHVAEARHHLELAEAGDVPAPLCVRVRAELDAAGTDGR